MQSPRIVFCVIFTLAFAVACKDGGDPVSSATPLGNSPSSYSYKAYNSKGSLVVAGTITLAVTDGGTMSGRWTLECVAPGEKVGPQTGTGTLSGTIQGTTVTINLNPGWVDNNVFLSGSLDKDRLSGTWMWSTFVGSTSQGGFEAIKFQ
jgi:hypothetical protein